MNRRKFITAVAATAIAGPGTSSQGATANNLIAAPEECKLDIGWDRKTTWLLCANILTETMACLPFQIYRRQPGGNCMVEAPEHPLNDILRYSPNSEQFAIEFWRSIFLAAILDGMAFARVVRWEDNVPVALERIDGVSGGDKLWRRDIGARFYTMLRIPGPGNSMAWHDIPLITFRDAVDVARYWRIPPHMIGLDDPEDRRTVEEMTEHFIKYMVRPWARRIEQAVRLDLIGETEPFEARLNVGVLVRRGNDETRDALCTASQKANDNFTNLWKTA